MSPVFCSGADEGAFQNQPAAKARISSVSVDGNRLISTNEILAQVKTKAGDTYDRDRVANDLRAINELGYFDEKSLKVEPSLSGDGQVKLTFYVKEKPPVSSFSFEGNHVLSTARLTELFADQIAKPQNLTRLSNTIDRAEALYREQGYILGRFVDVKSNPDGVVIFKIDEGRIDEVRFESFNAEQKSALTKALDLQQGSIYNEQKLASVFRDFSKRAGDVILTRSITPSEKTPSMFTLTITLNSLESLDAFQCPDLKRTLTNTIFMKTPKSPSNAVPALLFPVEMERMIQRTPYSGRF